jgi:hypothetical protein
MSTKDSGTCYHSNRYDAASACEHCEGIIRHEPWCIRMNGFVYYAYEVVLDADKITTDDALRLHSLGVTWTGRICPGTCNTSDINRSLF